MPLFDSKVFNGEVFAQYVDAIDNLNRNALLKSRAVVERPQYATMLADQVGGNFITVPIKARIGGVADNYNGSTNIGTDSRKTYSHGRIVVGRAHGWTEKDFTEDITGEDFMPAAREVAEYWDDVDNATLLSTLAGAFAMTSSAGQAFVAKHTMDITGDTNPKFDATTLNSAVQKALGDNKSKFALAIMHSSVATNLENLQLLNYAKYTDEDGIEREMTLGTVNGRLVLIDDNCPSATVSGGTAYTTYLLGEGAIEYTDCGVKVPYELDRDPAKNGGEETIYSRQRKIFSPYGISFVGTGIVSPTDTELEAGANWDIANNGTDYFPEKAIAIARVISLG